MSEPIQLPHFKPMSALDGITMMALDTDPDSTLTAVCMAAAEGTGPRVIAILSWQFHGTTPGYLVVLYDQTKDPRAESEAK